MQADAKNLSAILAMSKTPELEERVMKNLAFIEKRWGVTLADILVCLKLFHCQSRE
jgi:hypothetical protein